MIKTITGLCLAAVLFSMCKKQVDEDIDFSLLNGKSYVFNIEKVSNLPDVQFPSDQLQESDYTVTNEDIQYEIAFSAEGQSITIVPGAVHGTRIKDSEKSLTYELDKGLFAGGRLVIWIHDEAYEAEYTVYGSGVPIVKSMRGILK